MIIFLFSEGIHDFQNVVPWRSPRFFPIADNRANSLGNYRFLVAALDVFLQLVFANDPLLDTRLDDVASLQ